MTAWLGVGRKKLQCLSSVGFLKGDSLNVLLALQWIAGLVDLVVILLLPQYFLIHANISLFIFLALTSGFAGTLLLIKLKDRSFFNYQKMIVVLNLLLAFTVSFHDFASIRWVGPLNVFAGSFLYGVAYKFSLFGKLYSFLRGLTSLALRLLPGPEKVTRCFRNYTRQNRVKIQRRNQVASRKMRKAGAITYVLIFLQLMTIFSIPGCALMASRSDVLSFVIERIYVDKSRYPSVVGDRVFSLKDQAPDSRLAPTPLYCSYYQYFNGRAVISCFYFDGQSAYVESINQDGCRSPECKPTRSIIAPEELQTEHSLAKMVRDEEISRKLKNFVFLVLLAVSLGSPILLPLLRWLQWKTYKD